MHESWKDIPLSQAEFHLRAFLSLQGYYAPKFSYEHKKLFVQPGSRLVAKSITFFGVPDGFEQVKLRGAVGATLNSELLDTIQNWSTQRLAEMGYACPKIEVQALQGSGEITVTVQPGPAFVFSIPKLEDSIGLNPNAIRRFDAMSVGKPFTADWVKLTENRAENDGIVVSSKLSSRCPQVGPELETKQQILGGDKRLFTIGAGASTEEIPIVQASFKNVRLDANGSSLLVSAYASSRIEKLQLSYSLFAFDELPRLHLDPSIKFERDDEKTYTAELLKIAAPFSYQFDVEKSAWVTSLGPALSRIYSQQYGYNQAGTFLSLIANVSYTTHNYELFQYDPRSGASVNLYAELFSQQLPVSEMGQVLRLTGGHLLQINAVFPPQWIFGFRYGGSTTLTRNRPSASTSLPGQYFYTMGGDQDLRGFGRSEVNNGTIGGLTSVYFDTELRFAKSLSLGIEPFTFLDVGKLGGIPLNLDPVLYYSPGVGIRWSTPFGSIRSTLAHGFVSPTPIDSTLEHFQFFLSFGREF